MLPQGVLPWIALDTSLTRRLAEYFACPITVRLLNEGRGAVHHDERHLLPGTAQGHVREIALLAHSTPVVTARTVVPAASRRLLARVRRLGTRPLAELLFADGPPRCLAREVARLREGMPARRLIAHAGGPCWARRSLFEVGGERLLVTEIFLPEVLGTA